jgi:hypothetical protein
MSSNNNNNNNNKFYHIIEIIIVIFYREDWTNTSIHVSAICFYPHPPHSTPICNPPELQTANRMYGGAHCKLLEHLVILSASLPRINYYGCSTMIFLDISVYQNLYVKGLRIKVPCRVPSLWGMETSRAPNTLVSYCNPTGGGGGERRKVQCCFIPTSMLTLQSPVVIICATCFNNQ